MPLRPDVVVVGAGLAGLTCARALHRLGADVLVLEAEDGVGGRVRTDLVDGFRLDRGFQLYNPAYPAGQRTFDHDRLDLHAFEAGVEVFREGSWRQLADPRRTVRNAVPSALTAARGQVGAPWELAAFGAYAYRCAVEPPDQLRQRADVPMAQALQEAGVRGGAFERLVQPFLSGVFADEALATSRRFGDFVLRSFVRGSPGVPAEGMQALPEQIAAGLPPGALRLRTRVRSVRPGVVTTTAGEVAARVVVVANADLLDRSTVWSALTTWYFTAEEAPAHGHRMLVVDGGPQRWLANLAVLTSVAPTYSASGRPLIAATAVGWWPAGPEAERARTEAAALLGVSPADLQEVARYPIQQALPRLAPGTGLRRPVVQDDGLVGIGDHRDTPSIQGALVSGERGAIAAFRHLANSGRRAPVVGAPPG
jgi:glycine/D-amino acid oxidase-like deaminating enzyme